MKKIYLNILLFTFFIVGTAQVVVENETSVVGDGVTSLTVSHTVTNSNNRLLLVGISLRRNNANATVSAVTYGSQTMTSVGTSAIDGDNEEGRMYIYELVAPNLGTANVVATFNAAADRGAVVGAVSFSGVDQSAPLGAFSAADGDNNSPSLTNIQSATNELIFNVLAVKGDNISSANAGQTIRYNGNSGDQIRGAASTKAGSANASVGWTIASDRKWALGAVSVKPVLCPIQATVNFANLNILCGATTGSIVLSNPSGATSGNYEYRLNSDPWQSSPIFSGLNEGNYIVQIRDANDTACVITLQTINLLNIENDLDCDSIPDDVDLDDDNDGILDAVECGSGNIAPSGLTGALNFTIGVSSTNPSSNTVDHNLNSITVGGTTYTDFILPDGYSHTFSVGNNASVAFAFRNTTPYNLGDPNWNTRILNDAFRTRNLNAYQNLQAANFSDGDSITLTYNTPITINGGVFIAITERNGNNPLTIQARDADNNPIGTINVIAAGVNRSFRDFPFNVGLGANDNVGIALFPVEDFGPLASKISSVFITFPNSTTDGADSKVFFFGDEVLANPNNNPDGDGFDNCFDTDSDNDGVPDALEANPNLLPNQIDVNGRLLGGVDTNGVPLIANGGFTPVDTDGDGLPNYIDIDSDNDGIVDVIESQPNFGYRAPTGLDHDNDGIDNAFDVDFNPANRLTTSLTDTDKDGTPDMLNLDSDGDGLSDILEAAQGAFVAGDADNDGLANVFENPNQSSGVNSDNWGQTAFNPFPATENPGIAPNWRSRVCTQLPNTNPASNFALIGISTHAAKQPNWPGNVPNGALVLESSNRGFVITRLSTANRDAATFVPVEGMLIYNNTDNRIQLYKNGAWVNLKRGCNN